ncbi:DEAD/DEAH box helicase [Roseicitreum antarcticum]|uniref:Helicase conserved C-terminal domain-containing protein n=2 Tax=Roseicitreum antarcticum TaxID=564137 RepID=A0A1H3DLW6_9RHOB|nr:helicase-related protein [Roseicitreum antarcticum]SDX67357.1 Helicase conserved C-terminal domain-containing protein [Roseicitreum antarcticum]
MTHAAQDYGIGTWCWHERHAAPCRVVDREEMWGATSYRVWLPGKDAVVRARSRDLGPLDAVRPTVDQILHTAAAAKLLDALEDNLLLAPIQSSVVPLPHQLYALNRAMSRDRIRYLLADEVGLGKTIEAGLILRELKLRGMAKRILVVAPKGLVRQWQAEMRLHFGENFQFIEPSELSAYRQFRDDEENLWRLHDQAICSLDSVKPLEGRRGWSAEQLSTYNRERFEDLISANWDLVIIDEAHRMGGSTDQVARYKLGAALAEAAPYLLLLSATPHQGKTDQFHRLMQLLDRDSFPDESSISSDRVRPFVVRTEKRLAIDAEGKPLFKPRVTRTQAVAWLDRHSAQQGLYEAVTEYVRHGYNQAMASKQRHIGFLMILMQRLVTSSTAAIRATLEKRLLALDDDHRQLQLFSSDGVGEWHELTGDDQIDVAVAFEALGDERKDVEALLFLARETEAQGTDAKAEALLEQIYKIQQEENDPELKVLVFTEFVPTQAMLAEFLESRGFSVTTLNGSMDMEARGRAQRAFSGDVRILVSTDAGGEGLNLQFCHIIVNFDMPWNPMRVEQRIGRVDRIGQPHIVRAINFVLEDTVEHRVREVLETKLAVIAEEFGVDKVADVMDSVEAEPLFDELFVQGLQDPASIETECDAVLAQLRSTLVDSRKSSDLLSDGHDLDADGARKWRDHPAQFWLERAITTGLPARGGEAARDDDTWRIRWADGSESPAVCFDARTAGARPDVEWVTLEDPRAQALISDLPRCVSGQPVPAVRITGLPDSVKGVWSLWEISLAADDFSRRRFLSVFVNDEGRAFQPTAKRIWDVLLTEQVEQSEPRTSQDPHDWFERSKTAAVAQGERMFSDLVTEHMTRIDEERARALYAFEARHQAIGRVGLQTVRDFRRKRLQNEHAERMANLDAAASYSPDLNALLVLRIGEPLDGGK